jgi:hypothetical protein
VHAWVEGVRGVASGVERRSEFCDHLAFELPRSLYRAPGQQKVLPLPLGQPRVVRCVEGDLRPAHETAQGKGIDQPGGERESEEPRRS